MRVVHAWFGVWFEYTRNGVGERLEEYGHLVPREHEGIVEEREALDELRVLLVEVLRLVLDLLY